MSQLTEQPADRHDIQPWRSALPALTAEAAVSVAVDVAERLRGLDPATPDLPPGLEARGGVALLAGQLDQLRPEQGWDRTAHAFLSAAVTTVDQAWAAHPGLFSGLGGIAFAGWALSRGGTRYGQLLSRLDAVLEPAARVRGGKLAESPVAQPFRAFDAVAGLAGTGGYLLLRTPGPALGAVLAGLVAFCGEGPDGPNWFTPPDAMGSETVMREMFPDGMYNCGLAHGVPGPLALLSLAHACGQAVPGQVAAIGRVGHWLADNRLMDEYGPTWPSGVLPRRERANPAHAGWCYGSPGVARALWLAGVAIDDPVLRELAVDAMAAVLRRPWSVRGIGTSPSLCHGVGGLLQITLRFHHDTGLFAAEVAGLTEQLLTLYRPDRPYGYYAVRAGDQLEDLPGLFDGAAGAALALLSAATEIPPTWDRLLLLS
jgi:hypothetical protein